MLEPQTMSRVRSGRAIAAFAAVSTLIAGAGAAGCDASDDPSTDGGVADDGGGSDGATGVVDSAADGGGDADVSDAPSDADGVDASADASVDANADAGDGSDGNADAGPLAATYVDRDINHVLVTGQSNSVSNSGTPVLSTTQPFTNLMFDTGVMPMRGSLGNANGGCHGDGCTTYETPGALVPLVEGDSFFNYDVETPAAGFANEISHLANLRFDFGVRPTYPAKHDVLASIHGRSGNTYWCLRKYVTPIANRRNTSCNYKNGYLRPFDQALMEVQSAKALATSLAKSYVVRAVATVHGESDHYSYTSGSQEFPLDGHDGTPNAIADYGDALVEWQADYESSIQAITGQGEGIPLFVSQISGWNDTAVSRVAQMELDAHVKAPGKVVLVGPSYAIPLDQEDCLHFTNHGARRLGEYFAKVYARVVFEGKPWEPVRPREITRAGAIYTVKFHVPKPPLVVDTASIAAAANLGFSYTDASGAGAPTITNVAITAADTVQITLSAAPTAGGRRLRYAMNQTPRTCIGHPQGARGNLHDSDDTPSRSGYPLVNWAVHFDVAAP